MANLLSENFKRELDQEPSVDHFIEAVALVHSNPGKGIRALEGLAEKGSVLSMLYIRDAYCNGRGIDRDIDLGNQWYRRAADHGSIEAAYRVANRYWHAHEFGKAVAELAKLVERGFTPAMFRLGTEYFMGRGVEPNVNQAVKYWSIAEANGHLLAKRRLSILLREGKFGIWGRIKGYLKLLRLFPVWIKFSINYPESDRLRDW